MIKICTGTASCPTKRSTASPCRAENGRIFRSKGWKVEQYLVAPVKPDGAQGLYAVLRK